MWKSKYELIDEYKESIKVLESFAPTNEIDQELKNSMTNEMERTISMIEKGHSEIRGIHRDWNVDHYEMYAEEERHADDYLTDVILCCLSKSERDCYELKYARLMSAAEIAEITNRQKETVKRLLGRARRKIEKRIEEYCITHK